MIRADTMNPLLIDLPEQIETPRLLLRCPMPGDGAMVHAGVVDALDALRAWPASLPWAMGEPSVEASEAFCRQSRVDHLARKALPMLMILKDGGHYIGGSGLHTIDWSVPRFELGYWCRPAFQRQGLVSEAVQAITTLAFEHLGARRIVCLADAANLPSQRVAERAGFELEGVMRHERRDPQGALHDTCLYAAVR